MLKKAILFLGRILIFNEKYLKPFLNLLMILMTVFVLYAVFMRYLLNAAPTWSEEVTRYLMVWVAMGAMGVAMRRGKHIGLSSLVEMIWRKFTPYVLILADVLNLLFWVVVLIPGVTMTLIVASQRSPSINMPMWIGYISVPIGGFYFILEMIHRLLRKIAHDPAIEEEYKEWDSV